MNFRNKPDFPEAAERFEKWWTGAPLDRPLVSLGVRERRRIREPAPAPRPTDLRARWMDIHEAERARHSHRSTYFLAESLPVYWANLGPVITSTLFGAELIFDDHTSWCDPIIHDSEDWERFLATPPNFDNVYWQAVEKCTAHALQVCAGESLVGFTDLHGAYDILSSLRGGEALCMDLLDVPDLVFRAADHAASAFNEAFRRQWQQLQSVGSTTWLTMYSPRPAYVPSCDFWCMVSPDMARELVLPSIIKEMELCARSIFHLDGVQALPHLDLVLGLKQLSALQWVYGAGQGPAARWIEVYKKALGAGKAVQVLAESPADALRVLDALGPHGVWLQVADSFETRAAAEEFLADVRRHAK